MKLTKENLIITLKLLKNLTIACEKYSAKVGGGKTSQYFYGRKEILTDIITLLEDEKEFEKVSDALLKLMCALKKEDEKHDA